MKKLKKPTKSTSPPFKRGEILKKMAMTIERTLESFGITARVCDVNNYPDNIEYRLEVALGTTLESITKLHKDIAMALASITGDIEIEAPIPGTSLIGIKVPVTQSWIESQNKFIEDNKSETPMKVDLDEERPTPSWREIISTILMLIASGFVKLADLIYKR